MLGFLLFRGKEEKLFWICGSRGWGFSESLVLFSVNRESLGKKKGPTSVFQAGKGNRHRAALLCLRARRHLAAASEEEAKHRAMWQRLARQAGRNWPSQPRIPRPNALTQLVSGLVSCPGLGTLAWTFRQAPAHLACLHTSVIHLFWSKCWGAQAQPSGSSCIPAREKKKLLWVSRSLHWWFGRIYIKIRDFSLVWGKRGRGGGEEVGRSYKTVYLNSGDSFLIFTFCLF